MSTRTSCLKFDFTLSNPPYGKSYEICFTRYSYKPKPMRMLAEVPADILALEQEAEGLLEEVLGHGEPA